MSLHKCSPAEVALIEWLQAEMGWKRGQQRLRRAADSAAAEDVRREEAAAASTLSLINAKNEHWGYVIRATGLRRRILEMHGPMSMGPYIACDACEGYDGGFLMFPCDTYTLARDWEE
jgi:hypothetical protein